MDESGAERTATSGIRVLLSDPNYVIVWTVGGLTGAVRWLQLLALGVYTFETTGSPLLVSMVLVLWMLPLALLGPPVGVLADRIDRKILLGLSIAMIMTVSAGMAVVAALGDPTFAHVAVAALLSGVFWATDMPIRRRLMGDLSGGHVAAAMSLDSATGNATRMLGPLLGGVMLQFAGLLGVFLLSAVVFAVCLVLILIARLPERSANTVPPAFVRDIVAGVQFVLGDRSLRRIFAITIVFNIWGFPFTSMIPVLGRESLDLDPFMVGVLSSLEGLGAFAGAILVAMLARPAIYFRVYLWGTILYLTMVFYLGALSFVAGGPFHSFVAASLAIGVVGMCSACFAAMQGTLSYMGAPPVFRSRVLGVLTLCIGTGPIGFFNVGWMAELFGVSWALCIIAAEGLFALVVLWAFSSSYEAKNQKIADGRS